MDDVTVTITDEVMDDIREIFVTELFNSGLQGVIDGLGYAEILINQFASMIDGGESEYSQGSKETADAILVMINTLKEGFNDNNQYS